MLYSYYIYYRVAPDKTEACEPAIKALLAAVERATGVAGRMLKKNSEPLLWMEIYENVAEAEAEKFEIELAKAAVSLGVSDFLQSESSRRTECFVSE